MYTVLGDSVYCPSIESRYSRRLPLFFAWNIMEVYAYSLDGRVVLCRDSRERDVSAALLSRHQLSARRLRLNSTTLARADPHGPARTLSETCTDSTEFLGDPGRKKVRSGPVSRRLLSRRCARHVVARPRWDSNFTDNGQAILRARVTPHIATFLRLPGSSNAISALSGHYCQLTTHICHVVKVKIAHTRLPSVGSRS